jgi:hypothetical protein
MRSNNELKKRSTAALLKPSVRAFKVSAVQDGDFENLSASQDQIIYPSADDPVFSERSL